MTTYRIAVLLDAYQPDLQGDERPRIREEVYDTIEEAREVVCNEMSQPLYYGHNVYGRTLLVIDDGAADYIEGGRNSDMSNYDWDDADCECGECDTCYRMMIDQDRRYILSSAL